jgi:glutathione S-transferase
VLFIFARMEAELAHRGPWLAGATFSPWRISMLAIVHRIFEFTRPARPRRVSQAE